MKTSKKAFWLFLTWCGCVQLFCAYMIYKMQDPTSLAIFTSTSVVEPVAIYKFYLGYNKDINIKDMDMNYNPNYDSERGLY